MADKSSDATTAATLAFGRIDAAHGVPGPEPRGALAVRALVRSVTEHQKEALVVSGEDGSAWRLASDEGAYFGGTDLAPPPLGIFSAGVAASYVTELLALAARRSIPLRALRLTQDSVYTTEGSALRGTIAGGALPIDVLVEADTPADDDELRSLAREAIAASPLHGLLRGALPGRFSLCLNGEDVALRGVPAISGPRPADPRDRFGEAGDAAPVPAAGELMAKVEDRGRDRPQPAGAERPRPDGQARRPHAQAVCTVRDDGVKVIDQRLFQPPGSHFRLLSDEPRHRGEAGRAPDAMSYVASGLAFCFMTQVIRYAQLTKLRIDGCRMAQDIRLRREQGRPGAAEPPETHLFLDSPEAPEAGVRMLEMGQRMCFLHAFCATALDVELTVRRRSPASCKRLLTAS
jgi:uncharacterized OsmC-like protein